MSPPPRPLQQSIAVISAAVIAVGVALLGWATFTVLALYWLENVIIGGFTALRILAAGARTERYLESLGSAAFFTVHYGLFCLVHGVFVATLFGNIGNTHGLFDPVLLMIGRIAGDRTGSIVVGAMFVAAATDALRAWGSIDADDEKAIARIMFEPYGRIVVLHVVLIGGGVLMQMLQAPSLAALLLVAFKLAYDLRLLAQRGTSPAAATAAGGRSN
jgi:hypothetical protein